MIRYDVHKKMVGSYYSHIGKRDGFALRETGEARSV